MQLSKFCLLCTLAALTQNSLAAANNRTLINDEQTAKVILGQHFLSYQLVKRSFPGKIMLTNSNGVFSLQAKQIVPTAKLTENNNTFTIDGKIIEINSDNFKFTGTIITKFGMDAKKQCTKTGTFYFAYYIIKGKPSRWRLLQNQHTCNNKIIRVEFLASPQWKPQQVSAAVVKWGIGIITKDLKTERGPFNILFPADGKTTLYDKPNGSKVAIVNVNLQGEKFLPSGISPRQLKYQKSLYSSVLIRRNNSIAKTNIHPQDIIKMQSSAYAIKVYKVKDGFLQILPATMRHKTWVSADDLAKQGYQFSSWRDFLLTNQSKSFKPSGRFAINVRAGAGTDMKKLTIVKGLKYKISLTGQTKGDWMEVKVRKLSTNCRKTLEKWIGWIKALDATGFPNVNIRRNSAC